jgi:transcriptional regulator GlxA family with amidase domain
MENVSLTPSKPPAQNSDLSRPEHIVFLLVEGFTHLALSGSVEVLRVANLLSGRELYRWTTMAQDRTSQCSSNGLETKVQTDLLPLRHNTRLYVVSGNDVQKYITSQLITYLRTQHRHGVHIGAVCSGSFVLAKAGLLTNGTCAVHWAHHTALRELYPDINITADAFYTQTRHHTASGGTAGAEMMLHLVSEAHGSDLANEIADYLVLARVRGVGEQQRMPDHIRYGTRNKILLQSVKLMDANIEEPLTTREISDLIGISVRQMERTFRNHVGQSPGTYYKEIRLQFAKNLIATTDMSIIQIAISSGFSSASHFSRIFKAKFGETPYGLSVRQKIS